MPLSKQEWLALEKKAHELRRLCLDTTYWAGSGHIGGGMSVMDMLTVLYHKYMRLDVKNPKWEDRDRFILSKGHAGIAYAPVLVDFGWNDPEQLKTFNHTNSKMGIHLDSNKVVGVDASTGSLGHGLPVCVGMALAGKMDKKDYRVYTVMGDGELAEGSVWEGAMSAGNYKLDNLCAVVDRNRLQISGNTEDVMKQDRQEERWAAFGWNVLSVPGNDMDALVHAFELAKHCKGKPTVIIANTTKGCGSSVMENKAEWHHKVPTPEEVEQIMKDLDERKEALS